MAKKALVVGINAYDPPNALPSCVNDADSIVQLLCSSYGFSQNSIQNLRDKEASKAAIITGLRNLANNSGASDELLFYYSGHGYSFQQGNSLIEALVPQDADFLTSDEVADITSAVTPKSLTVILDSCYSGGMQKPFSLGGVKPAQVKFWTATIEEHIKAFAPQQPAIEIYKGFGSPPVPILSTSHVVLDVPGTKAFSIVTPPPTDGTNRHFILLSACKPDETAAASTDRTNGRSAFTFALLDQIGQTGSKVGVATLVDETGQELRQLGVRQTPVLKVPANPAGLDQRIFLLWDQPIPEAKGPSLDPTQSLTTEKGFVMAQTSFNKDWISDLGSIISTITPVVAGALKDYQPPSKGFAVAGASTSTTSIDKGFFDDLTRVVATVVPAIVQGMKDFQPPSKGFSPGANQPFDKAWFDNITSIVATLIPQVVSSLKDYKNPGGDLAPLSAAAQKGWFDDITHVVASVLPVVIAATKDLQIAGAAKGFTPPAGSEKGWLDTLGDIARVAVPIALSVIA
jgi:hypothetical protein